MHTTIPTSEILQESLFDADPQTIENPSTPEQEVDTPEPIEGVSVDLRDYYSGLKGLARLRPRINTNANYLTQTAEAGTPVYNKLSRAASQKGSDIETEIGKSQAAQQRLEQVAKGIFATSIFAKDEMVKAGLIDETSARLLARKTYGEYTSVYFNPKNKREIRSHDKKVDQRLEDLGEK